MSDGAISQDEIDALLSGVSVDGLNSSGHVSGGSAVHIDAEALSKFAESLKDPLTFTSMLPSSFVFCGTLAPSLVKVKVLTVEPF